MPRPLRWGVRPLRFTSLAVGAVLGGSLLACSGGDPYSDRPPAPASPDGAAAVPDGSAPPAPSGVPSRHEDGKPLGKVLDDAPLPLTKMLGRDPAEAEAFLGPHLPNSKGRMKDTCVRYLPEGRTWFKCRFAWQVYSDRTGTFKTIEIVFEDGKVAGVAFEGLPGTGDFDPRVALRKVGLELPGEPKIEEPEANVKTWSWWNNEARLLVHGRQYRVRVSAVSGQWPTAKVEIILNDTLSEDEKARVFDPQVGPDGAGAAPPGE
ncbi:hypothetical protein [Paraliomyxa miuraensis]|uniref:hypothetical protein n=1 Tax=Paraliomyxa miuraensis TaxID=376150 RepID=UPI002252E02C|nr:hypothetical protein [Paraliomyxa miuraensis]MCX4240461.1 hypothetical protein [Paraliomyxa miuraensis]